ncbi:MAG: DNA gyrase C-terminal beta-propeller domain-containing protein, partial [Clostridia bacterium]
RRTMLVEDDSEAKIDLQELIVVEDVMVTLSKDGFIKRIPVRTYQRSNAKAEDIEYREGDELKFLFKSNTTENILLFTDKGNMYQVKGINIPEGKWKEKGERIDSIIKTLNCDDEKIVEAISVGVLDSNKSVQFITNRGIIKKSTLDKFQTNYSKIQAIKLKENEFVLDIEILDNNEEKEFLKVETKLGLKFSLELPKIEDTPRNILGTQLFNLIESDEIIKVEYLNEFEFMTFSVGVTAKGSLKGFARAKASDRLKVNTDSISTLLLFTNKGNVYKIPSFLISNVVKEEISLENIIDGYSKNEKIIDVHSIKNFDERNMVYFFTKKGMIKKTSLKEYDGNYSIWQAYKFKYENDEVISVCIEDYSESEVLIISKKGMAIRFLSDNVNPMGRIAAGVTGISLKEDDEVIYGKIIDITSNNSDEIAVDTSRSFEVVLITSSKEKKTISTEEIRIQNRAGRGTNVMVISLDDEITEVQFS